MPTRPRESVSARGPTSATCTGGQPRHLMTGALRHHRRDPQRWPRALAVRPPAWADSSSGRPGVPPTPGNPAPPHAGDLHLQAPVSPTPAASAERERGVHARLLPVCRPPECQEASSCPLGPGRYSGQHAGGHAVSGDLPPRAPQARLRHPSAHDAKIWPSTGWVCSRHKLPHLP